jgi:glycosyltransferase involved in cell wall biosynthesis
MKKEDKLTTKTILYFGNIKKDFSRNRIYVSGLQKRGFSVIFATDMQGVFKKYWNLFLKHRIIRDNYDIVIVGYGGYLSVPLIRILTRKKIIFDALCSIYETVVLSRDSRKKMFFRDIIFKLIDKFSIMCADFVLVESLEQKKFFIEKFNAPKNKIVVTYTGADDVFFTDLRKIKKFNTFTVLFRGVAMAEAGLPTIVETSKILEKEDINFLILSRGQERPWKEFMKSVATFNPKRLKIIEKKLEEKDMIDIMRKCHVSLGQFSNHERLSRTIPHKAYEALAMGISYITARTKGSEEIFEDRKNCLMVKIENAEDLAEKIMFLFKNERKRDEIARNGQILFLEKFSCENVVSPIVDIMLKK